MVLTLHGLGYGAAPARAEPDRPTGWHRHADGGAQSPGSMHAAPLDAFAATHRAGGHYTRTTELVVDAPGTQVIDFRNSSTIGRFTHTVQDAQERTLAHLTGGIQSREPNPFFLRHGRPLDLAPGTYSIVTEVSSPFFLATPEPFVMPLAEYQQAIKPTNALTLLALGTFLGLGLYYMALAFARKRLADAMYAAFITGNFFYNGAALLFFSDVCGVHWFYLVSVPILFSNAAYVLFVVALLEIRHATHPRLYRTALAILILFAVFLVIAALAPQWSLELDRIGVGIFASYGLLAAIVRTRDGNRSARLYLVAVAVLFILSLAAISSDKIDSHTFFVEHLGLLAVGVEGVLLALVIAHQVAMLHSEKDLAVVRAARSNRLASTDSLTGLHNRYALENRLRDLSPEASLTFIDLDGLKHYNDRFGHQRGDELLCSFAHHLDHRLHETAAAYRLGGDEFAVVCTAGNLSRVTETIETAIEIVRKEGFEFAGASFGSVHVHEASGNEQLKRIADTRMYQNKEFRRSLSPERPSLGPAATLRRDG